jgi:hypothetical protein
MEEDERKRGGHVQQRHGEHDASFTILRTLTSITVTDVGLYNMYIIWVKFGWAACMEQLAWHSSARTLLEWLMLEQQLQCELNYHATKGCLHTCSAHFLHTRFSIAR